MNPFTKVEPFYKSGTVPKNDENPIQKIDEILIQNLTKIWFNKLTKKFAKSLKNSFGSRVLGPVDPVISKIRNYYHKNIMLKIESDSSIKKAKEILSKTIEVYKDLKQFRSIRINIDVDPY